MRPKCQKPNSVAILLTVAREGSAAKSGIRIWWSDLRSRGCETSAAITVMKIARAMPRLRRAAISHDSRLIHPIESR